eukprot:scaffold6893_cov90-Amphora_coffeaeformis.AAC.1
MLSLLLTAKASLPTTFCLVAVQSTTAVRPIVVDLSSRLAIILPLSYSRRPFPPCPEDLPLLATLVRPPSIATAPFSAPLPTSSVDVDIAVDTLPFLPSLPLSISWTLSLAIAACTRAGKTLAALQFSLQSAVLLNRYRIPPSRPCHQPAAAERPPSHGRRRRIALLPYLLPTPSPPPQPSATPLPSPAQPSPF